MHRRFGSQISPDPRRLPGPAVAALAGLLLVLTISVAGSVAMASPSGGLTSERGAIEGHAPAPGAAREVSASTPAGTDARVYLPLVAVSFDSLAPVISSLSPVQGPVGEKVVIGGRGFGASRGETSHIVLHNVPVPDDHILAWSDDEITIRVPAEATTGSVVVLVGDKNSGGVWFTVTSPFVEPAPEEIAVDSLTGETVVRDEILVGFWPGTPPEEIGSVLDTIGGDIIGHDLDTDRYQIKIPGADPAGIQALMNELAGNIYINYLSPHIVTSEPVGVVAETEDAAATDLTEVVAGQFLLPADSSSRFMGETSAPLQSFVDEVIRLTNEERTRRGLRPLLRNDNLTQAATGHSRDMSDNNFYSHTGSDGSQAADRIRRAGYTNYSRVAENIFAGPDSPQMAMYGGTRSDNFTLRPGWMDSPGHRANILTPEFCEIGVGYVFEPGDTHPNAQFPYYHYWTVNFGTRRGGPCAEPPPPPGTGITSTPTPTATETVPLPLPPSATPTTTKTVPLPAPPSATPTVTKTVPPPPPPASEPWQTPEGRACIDRWLELVVARYNQVYPDRAPWFVNAYGILVNPFFELYLDFAGWNRIYEGNRYKYIWINWHRT